MTVFVNKTQCQGCNYCKEAISCPGEKKCTSCGACVAGCPFHARRLVNNLQQERRSITCFVNGQKISVCGRKTVLYVLETLGFRATFFPEYNNKNVIFAPCRTGGCYSCAVKINREVKPSCITPIKENMVIETDTRDIPPRRIVSGFQGHFVGGVGTPKDITPPNQLGFLEVACFSSGCLYRCRTCQNWQITYLSKIEPITPRLSAERLSSIRRQCQVNRMAISGGESTLNKPWLLAFVKHLKLLNPEPQARIHIDTNAAILTPDYIDELIQAGMTDIGPDLKGIRLNTFMQITQLNDQELAAKYQQTSWEAAKYILDNYSEDIFLGIGLPYNQTFMSFDELHEIGEKLVQWDPEVQVIVLDYRPAFRAHDLKRPPYQEMRVVRKILKDTGLKKIICQTSKGYIK